MTLALDLRHSLGRRRHAPHLIECVHIERQIIELALIVGYGRVGVAVELHQRVDELPHPFIRGVEDVGTVLMYVDALYVLAIHVTAELRALVDDQAPLALLMSKICECGTEKAGANYEIIVSHEL